MQMYIEDAVFNTVLIDGVIIFLTGFILRIKFKFFKTLLACLFGCFFSIVLSNYNFYPIVLILLKLCCGTIICIFMLEKLSFKSFLVYFLVFISFTFLLGGFSYAFLFFINGKESFNINIKTTPPTIFAILYLIMALYICFLVNLIKGFYKKQKLEKFIYNIKMICNGKSLNLKGYLDSGNFLVDSKTNLPIVIINLKTFFKIFKNINIVDVLSLGLNKKIQGEYINCSTINGQDKIFVFKPESIEINNQKINALLGFSYKFNVKNENFDVLLNPLCVGGWVLVV